MNAGIVVSVAALVLSAASFFYKMGQDTKGKTEPQESGREIQDARIEEIARNVGNINAKLDKVMEWQMEVAGAHARHGEQIDTLFHYNNENRQRMERMERKLDERAAEQRTLEKILERISARPEGGGLGGDGSM